MQIFLLTLFFAAVVCALAAWWYGRRMKAGSGIPLQAKVVYSDTGAWKKVEKPLFSPRYMLTGRPDYLVMMQGVRIPIEVKPNRVASAPRPGDTLQLAAYGLLIQEEFGSTPPYGLLKYRDALFQIEFTPELRAHLLEVLNLMRGDLDAVEVARDHADGARCRACGYRSACGQALE